MSNKNKKSDTLLLLIIPVGLCLMAALWYLFGFYYGLLAAVIYFPFACLRLFKKK